MRLDTPAMVALSILSAIVVILSRQLVKATAARLAAELAEAEAALRLVKAEAQVEYLAAQVAELHRMHIEDAEHAEAGHPYWIAIFPSGFGVGPFSYN